MTKTNFSIPEIHCMSCDALIRLSLKKLPGILGTAIDIHTKTANIDFDENIINKKEIQQQIEKETGYKVF